MIKNEQEGSYPGGSWRRAALPYSHATLSACKPDLFTGEAVPHSMGTLRLDRFLECVSWANKISCRVSNDRCE